MKNIYFNTTKFDTKINKMQNFLLSKYRAKLNYI